MQHRGDAAMEIIGSQKYTGKNSYFWKCPLHSHLFFFNKYHGFIFKFRLSWGQTFFYSQQLI